MSPISAGRRRRRLRLETYRSYGLRSEMAFTGRVLANPLVAAATGEERRRTSIRRMQRRFLTREVAAVQVRVAHGDKATTAVSSSEGYFRAVLDVDDDDALWVSANCSIVGSEVDSGWLAHSIVIDGQLDRLVISDIDDTVLENAAGRTIGTIIATLTGSLVTRRPVEGASELYGHLGDIDTAFVYVSSSPWNLHSFLTAFLERHGFPRGPVILRDFGLNRATLGGSNHGSHKADAIRSIMALCPNARVVLIGDTSQQDPEAFAEIAIEYPSQVVAVCLRDVGDALKAAAARQRGTDVTGLGIVYEVVKSMAEVALIVDRRTSWCVDRPN